MRHRITVRQVKFFFLGTLTAHTHTHNSYAQFSTQRNSLNHFKVKSGHWVKIWRKCFLLSMQDVQANTYWQMLHQLQQVVSTDINSNIQRRLIKLQQQYYHIDKFCLWAYKIKQSLNFQTRYFHALTDNGNNDNNMLLTKIIDVYCIQCGYLCSFHQMAPPVHSSILPIPSYYSFIDPKRMLGWVGIIG